MKNSVTLSLALSIFLSGCDGKQKEFEQSVLRELKSLKATSEALEGSSTRSEYYTHYSATRDRVEPLIEKIKEPEIREKFSAALGGYETIAKNWNPTTRKEATDLGLAGLTVTIALDQAQTYALLTPKEREQHINRVQAENARYEEVQEQQEELKAKREEKEKELRVIKEREALAKAEQENREDEKAKAAIQILVAKGRAEADEARAKMLARKEREERERFSAQCIPGGTLYNRTPVRDQKSYALIPAKSELTVIEKTSEFLLKLKYSRTEYDFIEIEIAVENLTSEK